MKFLSVLFASLILPAAAASNTPSANVATPVVAPANSAPVPVPSVAAPALKLDDYFNDLATTLKLSDDEKKAIRNDYTDDGVLLKNILNNDSLSSLQKEQQISDLRDARNAKIEALLHNIDRQQAFRKIEAKYRVSLTELAADGGLAPAPAPTPVPPPTTVPAAASTNAPSTAK